MTDVLFEPRLPSPSRAEADCLAEVLQALEGAVDWTQAAARARPWIVEARERPAPFWALESLLHEYPISSREGLALMRMAEALLRIPDAETAIALASDQLGSARFDDGQLTSKAIALSRLLLPGHLGKGLFGRLGSRTVVAAAIRALQLLGRQFVFGQTLDEALAAAADSRSKRPNLHYSFDMLGEGARTGHDAERYLDAYADAVTAIGNHAPTDPRHADGISIKLSAIHPRYEALNRDDCAPALLARVWPLCTRAAAAGMNLTIDAEESERLELSLAIFDALAARAHAELPGWRGLGLAVQAYQTRALAVIDHLVALARRLDQPLMVRLVKGAYWDTEIKRAQELGLPAFAVWSRKPHTDLAYLACAVRLFAAAPLIYPQFASHNALTIGAILAIADHARARLRATAAIEPLFELQRLHGMGDGIYRGVLEDPAIHCRVYAPVGQHRDLLAYLVRRLLENGANSSFVNQLHDERVPVERLLAPPLPLLEAGASTARGAGRGSGRAAKTAAAALASTAAGVALPVDIFGARRNSEGVDLSDARALAPLIAAVAASGNWPRSRPTDLGIDTIDLVLERLARGQLAWGAIDDPARVETRAATLERAADLLQSRMPSFCALLVREAGKTYGDAVAEVREAIDFLRYYAARARIDLVPESLPGPTGESNTLTLAGIGVFVAISPWNFPLAIFTGQIAAALAAGNAVAAKPAEQTPVVAAAMVALLHEAGVPANALALAPGPGQTVGAALVAHLRCAGVVFTGSTTVAKAIQRALAESDGPIRPLIAETGGVNAMIVDSSALPEQVCDAVIASAFRSAGQRCSALRILCLHEAIADPMIAMIRGAMATLRLGDPADPSVDVGPLIDRPAADTVRRQVAAVLAHGRLLFGGVEPAADVSPGIVGGGGANDDGRARGSGRADRAAAGATVGRADGDGDGDGGPDADSIAPGRFVAPTLIEIDAVESVREEIFGPVLQVCRWHGDPLELIERINGLGYGLTLGIQSRVDTRVGELAARARIGNVYVNRSMIGAVVGSQPFGGEGLSGSGPKAGGPHYLPRFCREQTVTVNTAAAGGNAELLATGRA
jgi:RHH-type proline utilization regulon transcriptional repressor/proline dehydrogenase/delta 1-pyrroline-5-carboxylate dehydrogenase